MMPRISPANNHRSPWGSTIVLSAVFCAVAHAGPAFGWPNGARAAVVLTYDDSLDSQLNVAAPQLQRAHLRATFFLVGRFLTPATIPRWRALVNSAHELGNHSVNHPCPRSRVPELPDQYTNEHYTVETMVTEIETMNSSLFALDGKAVHAYATPCGEHRVGDGDYIEALRASGVTRFVRAAEPGAIDPRAINPFDVPCRFFHEGTSGAELIAYVDKVSREKGLGVLGFHGVGGDYLAVSSQAHQELVDYLGAHRNELWIAPFSEVMQYISLQSVKSPSPQVHIDAEGTVHAPPLDVPLSIYMSDQAKRAFIEQALRVPDADTLKDASMSAIRKYVDSDQQQLLDRARAIYAVNIEQKSFAGVPAKVITPIDGVAASNRGRVLINLHGGGFVVGAGNEALLESIPVAGSGKFKVISVDYRQAPEFKYPAASEDVARVYKELLKQYRSQNIGIYGCSAGGTLTAMAVAWLQKENLARPGAIGIFSAGAYGSFYDAPTIIGAWGGDSRFTAPPLVGEQSPPIDPKLAPALPSYWTAYLSTANLADPLVSPALSATVLAKFPPTLLLTGTRAYDMSATVQTQRLLTKAGTSADLHLWDGVGHCFILNADLPESQEAFAVITHFFDTHLGRHRLP